MFKNKMNKGTNMQHGNFEQEFSHTGIRVQNCDKISSVFTPLNCSLIYSVTAYIMMYKMYVSMHFMNND